MCQHVLEEVCGVGVVVGVSTWTQSSWFKQLNGSVKKIRETRQQSTSPNMTATETAKAMVVQATKDDKADVITAMTTTTMITTTSNKKKKTMMTMMTR